MSRDGNGASQTPDSQTRDSQTRASQTRASQTRETGWRGARRELVVAAALVATLATASYALAGAPAAGLVVLASVAVSLVILRTLINPENDQADAAEPFPASPVQSFTGFWRARADLADGIRSLNAWDRGPRARLQNLLAARLAERHGVSLATDPVGARRLLLGTGSDRRDLWYWIDPWRPTPPDADARPGIPPAVLVALIDKLEQL